MKAKKIFLILLVMFSLIIPFTLTPFALGDLQLADPDIEWGVKEGKTYTWVVKESNEILGFLPVKSKYEITITSIRSLLGGNATELNATITEYNSQTELTTTLLDNQTFIYFNSMANITTIYTLITEHGFFIPPDYVDGFALGLLDFYGSFFNPKDALTKYGIFTFFGYRSSTDLVYMWMFNKDWISDNVVIAFLEDDPENFQYWLVLKTDSGPTISFGNLFLISSGFAILSLIYIYKKKLEEKF